MEITNIESTADERQYAMFLHLSQFAGILIAGLGWILPLILWLVKKDTSAYINANGKIVINWIISSIIYAAAAAILIILGIGIVMLIALGVCSVVFTIIGAIKASNGEIWRYPLNINILN